MIAGKLSVVLPAHNEIENVGAVISRSLDVLPELTSDDFELIVVDDGSTDGTSELIDHLAKQHAQVRAVHHQRNRGYGSALISGFEASTGSWIMIMDSDQQFDIADLIFLAPFIGDYDIVAGYRVARSDRAYRRLYANLFKLSVRALFGLKFRDIDCAFKVIRADLIRSMNLTSPGALISTEILARAMRSGARWIEVGVNHYPRASGQSSGGSPRVVLKAMWEIVALWFGFLRDEARSVPARLDKLPDDANTPPSVRVRAGMMTLAVLGVLTTIGYGIWSAMSRRDRNRNP